MAIEKLGMMHVPPVGGVGQGGNKSAVGSGFGDMLQDFTLKSIDAQHQGESMSMKAVDKKADLVDIVTAISNAEVTLDTAVTIRDRAIQAYQEIIRMPV